MKNELTLSELFGAPSVRKCADEILKCNEYTEPFGLTLSPKQALALSEKHSESLEKSQRIEFGNGITDKLITEFCTSPYISQDNYEETISGLIGLFYDFKNETWDTVSDDELIEFMKNAFNTYCHGSLEILESRALTGLSRHIRSGGKLTDYEQN